MILRRELSVYLSTCPSARMNQAPCGVVWWMLWSCRCFSLSVEKWVMLVTCVWCLLTFSLTLLWRPALLLIHTSSYWSCQMFKSTFISPLSVLYDLLTSIPHTHCISHTEHCCLRHTHTGWGPAVWAFTSSRWVVSIVMSSVLFLKFTKFVLLHVKLVSRVRKSHCKLFSSLWSLSSSQHYRRINPNKTQNINSFTLTHNLHTGHVRGFMCSYFQLSYFVGGTVV